MKPGNRPMRRLTDGSGTVLILAETSEPYSFGSEVSER